MSELTPQQTAESLKVSTQTLRRWSVQFAEFLGPDATPGRGRRRMYSIDDLAVLRRASDLLRSHSVDETLALLRVTPDQESTQALETLALPDLISEAKALQSLVMQLRGAIGELKQVTTDQAAELETMRASFQQFAARQVKRNKHQQAELEAMRARIDDLTARRSWWARLRGR